MSAELVAADLAFSADVGARGLEGWVDAFDEDGVQLAPRRRAVVGRSAIRELMAPGFETPGFSFSWRPERSLVAASGDLGFTQGLAEYVQDGEPTAWGRYLSVWRRTPSGWKVAFDTGTISRVAGEPPQAPPPDPDGPAFELDTGDAPAGRVPYAPLLDAERRFAEDYRAGGADAWASWFAEDAVELVLLREPVVGREGIRTHRAELEADANATLSWAPVYAEGSAADDLGFTYGGWRAHEGGRLVAWGKFAMAWRREGGDWRVAVDVGHRDGYRAPA